MHLNALVIILGSLILITLAGLHFYWILGGKWGLKESLPAIEGFNPGLISTAMVALGLLLATLSLLGVFPLFQVRKIAHWYPFIHLFLCCIFSLRALIGFIVVVLLKKGSGSPFVFWETRLYEPLCCFLALSFWVASAI